MSRIVLARALAVLTPIVAVAALFLFAGSSHADAQNASLSVSLATWKSTAGTIELCIDLRDAAVGETRQCPQRRLLTFTRTGENRWLRSRSIAVAPEVELWVRARRVGQRLDLGLGVSIEGARRGLRARSWSLDWPATPVDQWQETSAISLQLPVAPHHELWDAPPGIAVGARRLQMGTAAPEFRLPELGGENDTLRSLSSTRSAGHRITVIVFWASWAPFVGETLTVLSNLAEHEEDVFVLGVNVYEVREGAGQVFAQEHANNLLHLSDVDGSVARHYRVDGLPELFLLDARGVYRGVVRGAAPLAEILAAIQGIE
ncbi:MAG: TlpA disulfide reductase family protein [Chloroflexota bacterium]|nr:TlpA disulfide reductase family protein [Chloroflexota bacterium]MDE2895359.1 TlpA disulfide reductase family protein [Chloroflexota bacterium]